MKLRHIGQFMPHVSTCEDNTPFIHHLQKVDKCPDFLCGHFCVRYLNPAEKDDFYIFRKKFLQDYFLKQYKGGVRPRNPKSTHCAIWPKHLKKYHGKWDLITKSFDPVD